MTTSKIWLLVGYAGSGKSTYAKIFADHGIPIVSVPDLIVEEYGQSHRTVSFGESLGVRKRMFEKIGFDGPARLLTRRLLEDKILSGKALARSIVAEGLRAFASFAILRDNFDICTIALIADQQTRLSRLLKRNRRDFPSNLREFDALTEWENVQGLDQIFGAADIFIDTTRSEVEVRHELEQIVKSAGIGPAAA